MRKYGDSHLVWHVIVGLFIIAFTFMLVRPGAPAAAAVAGVANALAALTAQATGYKAAGTGTTSGTAT